MSTYVPWAGFISNNPGFLACRFLAATGLFACTKECQTIRNTQDLEKAQNPIASHPFAFNLVFIDARFGEMQEEERFPPKNVLDEVSFISLANFWLGK